ncbi:hypothetical protein [Spirillospora sp. CA-294931]|uniref:hypothetical protein n=1 Tax=Spirillospora sp. CA-294931 TaxID=3240042 RepID=UPI003D8BCA29
MDLWGHHVVGRDDRPLTELRALRPYADAVAGSRARDDNWQICSLEPGADLADSLALLVQLAAETGAPALLASVTSDESASVEGFSGPAGYWRAFIPSRRPQLRRVTPVPAPVADEVAAGAARWAAAAGHSVAPGPIVELLCASENTGTDDVLEELLNRLGLTSPPVDALARTT